MATRRQQRISYLRAHNFTPLEARELSRLPKSSPALRYVVQERDERRMRFEKIASSKIAQGKWRRKDVPGKWLKNLGRMYYKLGLRVKEGPTGKQEPMKKGSPNPWALYRRAEKMVGGPGTKPYVSPWELSQLRKGKTRLEMGLIFVQRAEKAGSVAKSTIRQWIEQKREAREQAKGKRRAQLTVELHRLERML